MTKIKLRDTCNRGLITSPAFYLDFIGQTLCGKWKKHRLSIPESVKQILQAIERERVPELRADMQDHVHTLFDNARLFLPLMQMHLNKFSLENFVTTKIPQIDLQQSAAKQKVCAKPLKLKFVV